MTTVSNPVPAREFDGRALIDGRRVWSASGARFDCVSPVDGRLLTQGARCDAADIDTPVRARAGTVHVNQYDEADITVPFGGFRQSGVGRDKSLHAFDKYTETKTTWIRVDSPV